MGIGAGLLFHYAMATPYLFEFWGDPGLMPREGIMDSADPWTQSVFFYFTAPWQWVVFHILFLICCAAFMAGWRTSWVKWIVLIGQISFDNRSPALMYGDDSILASQLTILCLACAPCARPNTAVLARRCRPIAASGRAHARG